MFKYRNNKPFTKTVSPQRRNRKYRFNSINFQKHIPLLKRARQTFKKKPQNQKKKFFILKMICLFESYKENMEKKFFCILKIKEERSRIRSWIRIRIH
jgi:hypothetical protein